MNTDVAGIFALQFDPSQSTNPRDVIQALHLPSTVLDSLDERSHSSWRAGKGAKMLLRPSPRVQDCLQRAADCAQSAQLAKHPETKQFWMTLEQNWRLLSERHQQIERID